ncbi:MAG: hypothetical protein AAB227_00450 [Pseudomonadota bacterium]
MKAFAVTREQIASVAASLTVDELGSRFGRHIDTLTGASWSADTPLFEGGAELSPEEARACLFRLYRFFGREDAAASAKEASSFGEWADGVAAAIRTRLSAFSFSAARDDEREYSHRSDTIYADAASAANLLYGRRRLLSLVAPHSLIGFTLSVLTPNLLQAPSVDVRSMAPDEMKKFLAFGDALIATPSLWRYMLAQGVFAPDNAMAVFFGEPMTADLASEIRKAGFGAQREIYGSTEHGLIGWRDVPSDPFALFDNWRKQDAGLRRVLPSGETAEVTPMDELLWEGDRRFRLGGRRDGAVQIGGVNVFPARIAQKIAEHPEIRRCEISVTKQQNGADRLVVTIELNSGAPPSESTARSIDSWCRAKLQPYERPRLYSYAASAGK